MRLLHTTRLELKEFIGRLPEYAILSHTWGEGEVSFQDLRDGDKPSKPGYNKIKGCGAQAARDGYEYVWIDTCCIDKSSSSELSESINSMFQWYKNAHVCYAYLSDVPGGGTMESHSATESHFRKSRWFTRGWTLQELIAPETVVFFDHDWAEIGTKSYLQKIISSIAPIDNLGCLDIKSASIAQKMSWASNRNTTRVEDEAYCLIGLFGINMPLLYGEGRKAFTRLQHEIVKATTDESIFAWSGYGDGMFAERPFQFRYSRDILSYNFDQERPAYSMTNKGFCMELILYQDLDVYSWVYAPLNCYDFKSKEVIVIILKKVDGDRYERQGSLGKRSILKLTLPVLHTKRRLGRRFIYVDNMAAGHYRQSLDLYVKAWVFCVQLQNVRESGFTVYDSITHNQREGDGFYGEKLNIEYPALEWDPAIFCKDLGVVFTHNNFDCFIVELQGARTSNTFGVNIIVLEGYRTWQDVQDFFAQSKPSRQKWDRISRQLPSGQGVTVTINKQPSDLENRIWSFQYLVNITIDPEGKLRWPEP